MAERDPASCVGPRCLVIGTAMRDRARHREGHPLELHLSDSCRGTPEARDAAH
jgi:hypothetical protein